MSAEVPHEPHVGATRSPLPPPRTLRAAYPISAAGAAAVEEGRGASRRILRGEDERFLVIVGPCSIHDPEAAIDYATRLAPLAAAMSDRLHILMRAYFEKPRTTVGWRGLINDPQLDGTNDMEEGLRRARRLLVEITALGLPVATELLDTATHDYYADLISLGAIGARTTESQPHRAMASGLPIPIGFKNATDGGVQVALDAMVSASAPHSFLGFDDDGRCCVVRTTGNPDCVLILRGGRKSQPNFDRVSVARAVADLDRSDLPRSILVDASHANSGYDPDRQPFVAERVAVQRSEGERSLRGVMIESNLHPGKQSIGPAMRYGVSVTDGCLGWDDTAALLERLHAMSA
ncbi:MAG: 3-deoxy-7-phosphoheptulonate synthase [Armatimonadota bacterium]